MGDSDRRAKLRETVVDLIAHSSEAIDSPKTPAPERRLLKVANSVLLDWHEKLVKATDAIGGESSPEAVQIWNAAIALMNTSLSIGSLTYRTTRAHDHMLIKQAKIARDGRASADEKKRKDQQALLLRYISDVAEAKRRPWKTAESIREAVSADLLRGGAAKGATSKTISRWIKEMPDT